jgi:hypothetical protein
MGEGRMYRAGEGGGGQSAAFACLLRSWFGSEGHSSSPALPLWGKRLFCGGPFWPRLASRAPSWGLRYPAPVRHIAHRSPWLDTGVSLFCEPIWESICSLL